MFGDPTPPGRVFIDGEPYLDEHTDKKGKRHSLKPFANRLVLMGGKAADKGAKPAAKAGSSRIDAPFDDDIPF
jgi:hypothetical protein